MLLSVFIYPSSQDIVYAFRLRHFSKQALMLYNETSEFCAWLIEYLAPTFFSIPIGVFVMLYIVVLNVFISNQTKIKTCFLKFWFRYLFYNEWCDTFNNTKILLHSIALFIAYCVAHFSTTLNAFNS